jgi:hypothetical protein
VLAIFPVLDCWGSHYRVLQTGWPKQYKVIFSQFWSWKSKNDRVGFFPGLSPWCNCRWSSSFMPSYWCPSEWVYLHIFSSYSIPVILD